MKIESAITAYNVDEATKTTLVEGFGKTFAILEQLVDEAKSIEVKSVDDTENMQLAHNKRLELKDIRVNAEKTRKAMKEESLRKGKAIDGLYNVIAYAIEDAEKHLLKQEKFVEIQKKLKADAIKAEREKQLLQYTDILPDIIGLENMSDETFWHLLESYKIAKQRKIEAEKKAEEEEAQKRKKEEEERKELEKRAKEAEAKLEAERKQREAEQKEQEALRAKEKEKEEAQRQKLLKEMEEKRKEAEEAQKKLEEKQEAEDRARIEKERQEAEEKAKQQEAELLKKRTEYKKWLQENTKDGEEYKIVEENGGFSLYKKISFFQK